MTRTRRQALSVEARRAIFAAVRLGLDSLRAEPPQRLSDWAADHFKLAGESSHQKGAWESWPFQIGWMDAFSNDDIEHVDVQKSKRVGYALALDTPIPIPGGWTTMGALCPGDVVFDEQGRPCKVRYCSPVHTDHECFRITFCDGASVVADKGHRWLVETRTSLEYLLGELGQGRVGRPKPGQTASTRGVIDTGQMAQIQAGPWSYNQLRVRNTRPLVLPDADLPIPPYALGLWLGDGHQVTPRITQHRLDTQTADFIRAEGIQVSVRYLDKRYPDNATLLLDVPDEGRPVSPWAARFRALGLLASKHIPAIYLRASIAQRLQLLRGLMDSDGTAGADGRCEFSNTNPALAEGVYELLVSMGVKASMRVRARKAAHHLDQYRVNFKPSPDLCPFNLPRKVQRLQAASRPTITFCRRVVRVEPVASVPVRCIEVDSPNHLFLCTRAMVPTHNTKTVAAFVAYNIAHRRRKQAVWQPTDDDRDSFVKSEIDPVLDGVAAVRAARRKGKGAEDTIKFKPFRDSVLHLLGGKAARAYRRITVAVAVLDEWSGFDQQIEKSSDPGTLAKGRLEGAPFPKFVGGSTPRIKGLCHVERSRLNADADLRYHIRCPHCGDEHPLLWGGKDSPHGIKWTRGQPDTVRHVCPHCGGEILQGDYLRAWLGTWVCIKTGIRYGQDRTWRNAAGAEIRPPRHVAFQVWAAYSPQRSWADIVREFEQAVAALAEGNVGPMQGFVNETLGETWEIVGDRAEEHALQARAEPYELCTVPIGALVLTAGVDVQGSRWEIAVWGWARGLESWVIDHHVIEGNPADERDWEAVTTYLQRRYPQAWHGGSLGIDAISIDSGHHTQAVYNWVRSMRAKLNVVAIKGASEPGKPIVCPASGQEVNWRGQKWPNGVQLFPVGTDTAKDLLLGQLQTVEPGPGYLHFSQQLPREWFEQLTAEQRILVRTPTGEQHRWVKRRPRNEVLDCRNYALHAAYRLTLHRYTDQRWSRLEAAIQPPRDLFALPSVAAAQPAAPAGEGPETPSTPPVHNRRIGLSGLRRSSATAA